MAVIVVLDYSLLAILSVLMENKQKILKLNFKLPIPFTKNFRKYIWGTHKTNLSQSYDILKCILCCKVIRFYATIYTKSLRNSSTLLQNGTNTDGSKYIWNSNNPFCYGITKCDSRHWKLPLSFSHGQLEMQTLTIWNGSLIQKLISIPKLKMLLILSLWEDFTSIIYHIYSLYISWKSKTN